MPTTVSFKNETLENMKSDYEKDEILTYFYNEPANPYRKNPASCTGRINFVL